MSRWPEFDTKETVMFNQKNFTQLYGKELEAMHNSYAVQATLVIRGFAFRGFEYSRT